MHMKPPPVKDDQLSPTIRPNLAIVSGDIGEDQEVKNVKKVESIQDDHDSGEDSDKDNNLQDKTIWEWIKRFLTFPKTFQARIVQLCTPRIKKNEHNWYEQYPEGKDDIPDDLPTKSWKSTKLHLQ